MPTIHPTALHDAVRDVCAGLGSPPREQALVADQLVGANLAGHDSHGVGMLPLYVDRATQGLLHVGGNATVASDLGAVVVMDGNAAFGQVTGHDATELAIRRCREHGIALVGLRDSFHIGRIGHWGEMVAGAGLVSIHFVNVAGHVSVVAPFGGREGRFGTNPYCVALPTGDAARPFVLDFATSRIALGKARVAMNEGRPVPPGTVVDANGDVTDDPTAMFGDPLGALVAMGDHKGSGLAMACELLGAALIGGTTMVHSGPLAPQLDGSVLNSMVTIAIDPAGLGIDDEPGFERLADAFLSGITSTPTTRDTDEVLTPGEPERRSRAARADGIPVDDATWAELAAAASAVGRTWPD